MCLNSVQNFSEIEQSRLSNDLAHLIRRAILGVIALLPNGSQECVDPTSPISARIGR